MRDGAELSNSEGKKMKIKIDGKICNISFWGFFKGYLLSWAFLTLIVFITLYFIGVFIV